MLEQSEYEGIKRGLLLAAVGCLAWAIFGVGCGLEEGDQGDPVLASVQAEDLNGKQIEQIIKDSQKSEIVKGFCGVSNCDGCCLPAVQTADRNPSRPGLCRRHSG